MEFRQSNQWRSNSHICPPRGETRDPPLSSQSASRHEKSHAPGARAESIPGAFREGLAELGVAARRVDIGPPLLWAQTQGVAQIIRFLGERVKIKAHELGLGSVY